MKKEQQRTATELLWLRDARIMQHFQNVQVNKWMVHRKCAQENYYYFSHRIRCVQKSEQNGKLHVCETQCKAMQFAFGSRITTTNTHNTHIYRSSEGRNCSISSSIIININTRFIPTAAECQSPTRTHGPCSLRVRTYVHMRAEECDAMHQHHFSEMVCCVFFHLFRFLFVIHVYYNFKSIYTLNHFLFLFM